MGSLAFNSRDASGLYYRRNRFYNAEQGRFTQEDPIGMAGGINVYGYANGDPVSYSDPYGLAACPNAPEGDPRRSNPSWSDCTVQERLLLLTGRSGQGGVDEPLFDPSMLIPLGTLGRGVGLLRRVGAGVLSRMSGRAAARATAEVSELTITHGPTLSRRAIDALTADIAENGMREPIKYVELNGHKFVVDGHHRLIAARRLQMNEVPVEQVQLPYRGYRTVDDLEFRRW